MRYKRMLFDAEGVPIGCAVCAGLWPALQLPVGLGAWRGYLLPCLSTSGSSRMWLAACVLLGPESPMKGFLFAL